jgi:hypothetical protein
MPTLNKQIPWNKGLKGIQVGWNKGEKTPAHVIKKLSDSHKGQIPWNLGIPRTKEEKRKMSIAHRGKVLSQSHRKNISIALKGNRSLSAHPNWKGGTIHHGYKFVRHDGKYISEHRLVMEKHLKRRLNPCEIVHHKDGNKINNAITNLELMTTTSHMKHHRPKKRGAFVCCAECKAIKRLYCVMFLCCQRCYVKNHLNFHGLKKLKSEKLQTQRHF